MRSKNIVSAKAGLNRKVRKTWVFNSCICNISNICWFDLILLLRIKQLSMCFVQLSSTHEILFEFPNHEGIKKIFNIKKLPLITIHTLLTDSAYIELFSVKLVFLESSWLVGCCCCCCFRQTHTWRFGKFCQLIQLTSPCNIITETRTKQGKNDK